MLALLIPGVGMGGGLASAPIFTGSIPDITQTINTGNYTYELGAYFTLATSYAIAPAVEAGWTFNTSTGQLVIDTDALGAFGPYTVTATNGAGSTPSNAFRVNVVPAAVVSADQPAGGWGFWVGYEQEQRRRRDEKRRREQLEEETEQIEEKLDRDIARLLREQEAQDARRADLDRLGDLARRHADLAEARAYSERVAAALERAIAKSTFSALEALDREIERAQTEEELVILISQMIAEDQ